MIATPPCQARKAQGFSLIIVLVVALLTSLIVLWSLRTVLFNDRVISNEADHQRAFEAAQAMVMDAQRDILMSLTGTSKTRALPKPQNIDLSQKKIYIPRSESLLEEDGGDLLQLQKKFTERNIQCLAGMCLSADPAQPPYKTEFWTSASDLTDMTASAATYGLFTQASPGKISNPVLNSSTPKAWYWIEPILYQTNSLESMKWAPTGTNVSLAAQGYVYRITAVAQGLRSNTIAVIQTVIVVKNGTIQ